MARFARRTAGAVLLLVGLISCFVGLSPPISHPDGRENRAASALLGLVMLAVGGGLWQGESRVKIPRWDWAIQVVLVLAWLALLALFIAQ